MVTVLDADEVRSLIELEELLDVIEEAFVLQGRGDVERPDRPHYPVGAGLDEDNPDEEYGIGLAMPAYIHGASYFATKLASVHDDNVEYDLPTIHAQISVNDAKTGVPVAYMDGNHITSARTGSVGGLAARELTAGPVSVAVIGAGTQGRWQVRAIDAATEIEEVRFSDLDEEMARDAVAELEDEIDATLSVAESAAVAVRDVSMVVTTTTSTQPVFPGEELSPGTVVVAIGAYTPEMHEIDETTFERAALVYADVPEEVIEIGDLTATDLELDDLVPYAQLFEGTVRPESADDIVVVESVGSAVMDAATAEFVYDRAADRDVGTDISL